MSQGIMQMKSKFFVAVVLFLVIVMFAFFFGPFRMRFVSMVISTPVAVNAVANNVMPVTSVLMDVSNVAAAVQMKDMAV